MGAKKTTAKKTTKRTTKKNVAVSLPSWDELDNRRKLSFMRNIRKALGGARYKLVSGTDQFQREQGLVERGSEDEILNAYGRGKVLDLARNATRNSSTFNGILKQLDLNVVGTKGGKAIFKIDGSDELRQSFSAWTREADFFDGLSFNTLLKLILKTYVLGGDMVLMFDDGLIEDSGKLVVYEPDEIGNTTEEALVRHYGTFAR